jgi:hypothetical protein
VSAGIQVSSIVAVEAANLAAANATAAQVLFCSRICLDDMSFSISVVCEGHMIKVRGVGLAQSNYT